MKLLSGTKTNHTRKFKQCISSSNSKNKAPITSKADVHSFNILLLGIVCWRKSMHGLSVPDEEAILMAGSRVL
uniref:Uncharacterized protein n=1 Tax=Salix viminalis TaxID=40686 RepID=A0A6N2KUA3_SALVM